MRRVIGGLLVICGLAAGWTTPPWFEVLESLPDVSTHVAVPVTHPGLSIARPPMDPFSKTFDEELKRRGHGRLHGAPWSALPTLQPSGGPTAAPKGRSTTRGAGCRPSSVSSGQQMRRRGVYRMGLIGRADPPTAPRRTLCLAGRSALDRSSSACAAVVPAGSRQVGDPYFQAEVAQRAAPCWSTTRYRGEPLQCDTIAGLTLRRQAVQGGIALVFPEDGSTTNSNPAWRGCLMPASAAMILLCL